MRRVFAYNGDISRTEPSRKAHTSSGASVRQTRFAATGAKKFRQYGQYGRKPICVQMAKAPDAEPEPTPGAAVYPVRSGGGKKTVLTVLKQNHANHTISTDLIDKTAPILLHCGRPQKCDERLHQRPPQTGNAIDFEKVFMLR